MGLNWNFQRGGGLKPKIPSKGGVWIFFVPTHFRWVPPSRGPKYLLFVILQVLNASYRDVHG